MIEYIYIWKWK